MFDRLKLNMLNQNKGVKIGKIVAKSKGRELENKWLGKIAGNQNVEAK